MRTRETIIEEFNNIFFYESTIESIKIKPEILNYKDLFDKKEYLILFDFMLGDYKKAKIEFKEVVNLDIRIDFDILLDNDFSQFAGGKAYEWAYTQDSLVSDAVNNWNTTYYDMKNNEKPIQKTPAKHKIIHPNRYVLFKLFLFGGVINILARDFNIQISE